MMEAVSTSETSVNFYRTTQNYNPEDRNLHKKYVIKFCAELLTLSQNQTGQEIKLTSLQTQHM
jgi:hypothetical protein